MIEDLDFYFPYLVLFYGAIMTLVTHLPHLQQQAERTFNHDFLQRFYGHRLLGVVCLFVGGLWSLQRLVI